jgi:translation elongation factor EF-4
VLTDVIVANVHHTAVTLLLHYRCMCMQQVLEPMVEATIITPADCLGNMLGLLKEKRGVELETK